MKKNIHGAPVSRSRDRTPPSGPGGASWDGVGEGAAGRGADRPAGRESTAERRTTAGQAGAPSRGRGGGGTASPRQTDAAGKETEAPPPPQAPGDECSLGFIVQSGFAHHWADY